MAIIYDIETLSQDQHRGVIVSIALLNFDLKRVQYGYGRDYTWDELLGNVQFAKFDVESQVKKHGRTICNDTLKWWKDQGTEAQKQLVPTPNDMDISELYDWMVEGIDHDVDVAYSRNNTFDPVFVQFLCQQFGRSLPHAWWLTRDTKSTIDGMTWGQNIKDSFVPEGLEEKFVAHDPRHDIVMDVMRLQYLSRILIDEIPF